MKGQGKYAINISMVDLYDDRYCSTSLQTICTHYVCALYVFIGLQADMVNQCTSNTHMRCMSNLCTIYDIDLRMCVDTSYHGGDNPLILRVGQVDNGSAELVMRFASMKS